MLDPVAGQIKIQHKTSQPFSPPAATTIMPRIATTDREIIFSKNTTMKRKKKVPSPPQQYKKEAM